MRDAEGAPVTELSYYGPIQMLIQGGRVWEHYEGAPHARVLDPGWAENYLAIDFRNINAHPISYSESIDDLDSFLNSVSATPPQYNEEIVNGLYRVDALIPGEGGFRWWIDSEKDWNATRIEWLDGQGHLQPGCYEFELGQTDGVWMPNRVRLRRAIDDPDPPMFELEVIHAEYNRPEHPIALDKPDIGIEVGMTIIPQVDGMRAGRWDGKQAVSYDEFRERAASGELTIGATYRRAAARAKAKALRERALAQSAASSLSGNASPAEAASPPPPRSAPIASNRPSSAPASRPTLLTPWEEFTRAFIALYELDVEQTQKAWLICRECQDSAKKILDVRATRLAAVDERVADIERSTRPTRPQELESAKADRKLLLAPIDAMFEKELRPRLFKLPTRAQLEKGAKSPKAVGPLAAP